MGQWKLQVSFAVQVGFRIRISYEALEISLPFIEMCIGLLKGAYGINMFGIGNQRKRWNILEMTGSETLYKRVIKITNWKRRALEAESILKQFVAVDTFRNCYGDDAWYKWTAALSETTRHLAEHERSNHE